MLNSSIINQSGPYTPLSIGGYYGSEKWNSWNHKIGGEDDEVHFSSSLVQIISYIVIVLVVLSFLAFLLCLCCPVCLLAKKRHRIRGHVYSRPIPGPAQISASAQASVPLSVIAIRNNPTQLVNPRPYPVQESVTIIPVLPLNIPHPLNNHSIDLPPPYPGNPTTSSNSRYEPQLPFNPYYTQHEPTNPNTANKNIN